MQYSTETLTILNDILVPWINLNWVNQPPKFNSDRIKGWTAAEIEQVDWPLLRLIIQAHIAVGGTNALKSDPTAKSKRAAYKYIRDILLSQSSDVPDEVRESLRALPAPSKVYMS